MHGIWNERMIYARNLERTYDICTEFGTKVWYMHGIWNESMMYARNLERKYEIDAKEWNSLYKLSQHCTQEN